MFTRTAGIVAAGTQPEGNLCRVPDVLQNSQKCRVLWCNCHRTHRSTGCCGTAVTELTEVLCGVKTEGNYPRYRSVGTLQNLSVESSLGNARGGQQRTINSKYVILDYY